MLSFAVNALMLTGPLYMLQVYDRVLRSRSAETLLALTLLAAFLFVMLAFVDHARGQIVTRIGARLQDRLDGRVFSAALRQAQHNPGAGPEGAVESLRRLFAAPVALALFDIPWTPFFIAVIFAFHIQLGLLALAASAVLLALAATNRLLVRRRLARAGLLRNGAESMAASYRAGAETLGGLGMRGTARARWRRRRDAALGAEIGAADLAGGFAAFTRSLRLFVQSAMLGLGAWLALRGAVSPGAMIAASVLLSRALAPLETAIAQWDVLARGVVAWRQLSALLAGDPPAAPRLATLRPDAMLEFSDVGVVPPGAGRAALIDINFRLNPGEAMGVIGPSGAGKSSLARLAAGVWTPSRGTIALGGGALALHDADRLGRWIGYLPQQITLFEGTVAQNIARLDPSPDPAAVIAAARAAGAEAMIRGLPGGFDTPLEPDGAPLSGGQRQSIGLARALYGAPVLLVLDEPNAHLDHAGNLAIGAALRRHLAAGGAALVMAHRPAAIRECGRIMALDAGRIRAISPRTGIALRPVPGAAKTPPGPAGATRGAAPSDTRPVTGPAAKTAAVRGPIFASLRPVKR